MVVGVAALILANSESSFSLSSPDAKEGEATEEGEVAEDGLDLFLPQVFFNFGRCIEIFFRCGLWNLLRRDNTLAQCGGVERSKSP